MDIRTILIFSLLLLILPTNLYPQQVKQVRGRVLSYATDPESAEALPYASVVVINESDSSFVKGTTTGDEGYFQISFSPSGQNKYLLRASSMGYTTAYTGLSFKEAVINLGNILLKDEGIELDEVTITASASEIRQVGDTTIINASAYKTPEGAYLEELVKRIPGLEYDAQNKTLTYNGLSINEIHVNGEPFFADNITMALENLQADLIDQIKVYNKQTELEKITGVRSGRENYILDLQTKGEFNGALMASAKAGFGSKNKKDFDLLANYFKKGGESFSFIGRSTNLNMPTSYKGNIRNSLGTNFTKQLGKELTLNGNIYYNGGKNGNKPTVYNEQYLPGGNKYQYNDNESVNKSDALDGSLDMRWEVNKKTFLNLTGRVNLSGWDNDVNNRQASFSENPGLDARDPFGQPADIPDEIRINDIRMNTLSKVDQSQYNFNGNITRVLNEKGSSLSLTAQYGKSTGKNKDFTLSSTTYYQLQDATGNDSVLYRNQYQYGPTDDRNVSVGTLYTHAFTKEIRLQLAYDLRHSKQENNRSTYDLSGFMEHPAERPGYLPEGYKAGYVDSLSNRSHSSTLNHNASLRLNYSDTIWNILTAIDIQPERRTLDQKTGLLTADTIIHSVGFQPSVHISWRKRDLNLGLNYYGSTRQPALQDLIALTDNRDPLNIVRGNPNLKPAFSQNLRFEMREMKKGFSIMLGWRQENNSHTRAVIYNPQTGGREMYPVNINGNWNVDGQMRYQKRFRRFAIHGGGGTYLNRNVSLVNEGNREQPDRSKTRTAAYDANARVSYMPKWGGIDFSGDWRYRHSDNTLNQTTTDTHDYSFSLNAYANLPGNFSLRTDARYSFRNGTGIEKGKDDQVVWNTSITWRFLKKKQAELSVHWWDILSQEKNYYRNATATGLSEIHTQQTGSYFIASLRYRFNRESK